MVRAIEYPLIPPIRTVISECSMLHALPPPHASQRSLTSHDPSELHRSRSSPGQVDPAEHGCEASVCASLLLTSHHPLVASSSSLPLIDHRAVHRPTLRPWLDMKGTARGVVVGGAAERLLCAVLAAPSCWMPSALSVTLALYPVSPQQTRACATCAGIASAIMVSSLSTLS